MARSTPGSGGGGIAAVFDVDETLINTKSMFAFLAFHLAARFGEEEGGRRFSQARRDLEALRVREDRAAVNRAFWRGFRGERVSDLEARARAWVDFEVERSPSFFNRAVCARLFGERDAGRRIVYLSGSADFILRPVVARLGGGDIVAIRLDEQGGTFTGDIVGVQTIGEGKRVALLAHLAATGASLDGGAAYGDHMSDLPFLEMATFPHVVAGDPALQAIAEERGWPILPGCGSVGSERGQTP